MEEERNKMKTFSFIVDSISEEAGGGEARLRSTD